MVTNQELIGFDFLGQKVSNPPVFSNDVVSAAQWNFENYFGEVQRRKSNGWPKEWTPESNTKTGAFY